MFTTLIVQPLFNLLTLIFAFLPGHNFGLAIIIFTIVIRISLFPLLKKQLKHTSAMRRLQPEIKKIKEKTKGNKQQEALLVAELYKEREIKPLSLMMLMVLQLVLFLALFSGLNRVVNDPKNIYEFSYPVIQNTAYMQEIKSDITKFDDTLLGVIDLNKPGSGSQGIYLPSLLLVAGSALIQFFQVRQTMPKDKERRKLSQILKDANNGKQADSAEVNAAVGGFMSYVLPLFIFVFTLGLPGALPLYWLVGGIIAYLQQDYLLKQDEYALSHATVLSKKPLTAKDTKDDTPTPETTKTIKTSSGVKVTTYTAGSQKPKAKPSKAHKKRRR